MLEIKDLTLVDLYAAIQIKKIADSLEAVYSSGYEEEEIYTELLKRYNSDSDIKFKILDFNTKEILYKWAQKKCRYPLLNNLMKIQVNRLIHEEELCGVTIDSTDSFLVNNLKPVIKIMIEQVAKSIFNFKIVYTKKISKINNQEFNECVCEILKEMDPTLEWLNIYIQAKKEGKIIYLDELSNCEKNKLKDKLGFGELPHNFCGSINGSYYLFLTRIGTIKDVHSMLHELAHYITEYNASNIKVQPTLMEFPSIFFELYSLDYLRRIGYSSDELEAINLERLENTLMITAQTSGILDYLDMFVDNLEIKEEDDIRKNKKIKEDIINILSEEAKKVIINDVPDFFDPTISAYQSCDDCIKSLVSNPMQLFLIYPYVLGNYLATKSMEMLFKDRDFLKKIKFYTEKVSMIDPYEVFVAVGCDVDTLGIKKGCIKSKRETRR